MNQTSLLCQFEDNRRFIETLPERERHILSAELAWASRSAAGYKFDRKKGKRENA